MTLAKTLTERPEVTLGCLNSTGSDIAAGVCVTGTEDAITLPGANQTDPILGITRSIIKNGSRGPVMIRGKAIAVAGAAGVGTAGDRVGYEASTGLVVTYSGAHSQIGVARYAAATTVSTEVELLGPGATGA